MKSAILVEVCEVCKTENVTCDYEGIAACGSCLGFLVSVNIRLIHFDKFGEMPDLAREDVPADELDIDLYN